MTVIDRVTSAYRWDDLGWLQFECLCELVVAAETGNDALTWHGQADRIRHAVIDGPLRLAGASAPLPGPVAVLALWGREPATAAAAPTTQPSPLGARLQIAVDDLDAASLLLLTNLDADAVATAGQLALGERPQRVWGGRELSRIVDRHPGVRLALPSVLGSRDLDGLISSRVRDTSSQDVAAAQALARVFWPTHAYARARQVVARHRFVVLTGPPEMGKTAIARMLALARMTDGWEAHECHGPEQLRQRFDARRRQVFVADDAFGSTEYRPDAAERWAASLGGLLAMLDDDHWLIWTSRPAPLKAGLRRVQRERHAERFPSPGEVLVDASELDLAEKTLILFRHAKARGLSGAARELVCDSALTLVEHPHFTPERIRRLVADRLDLLVQLARERGTAAVQDVLRGELSTPTEAMRTSYQALEAAHRELLVALLDAPAGLIDERALTATVRRHHPAGLPRPAIELIDRLTDHFLRVTPLGIGWVHPSWRDLVIAELQGDAEARERFLRACGLYGTMLALSVEGGTGGERSLPLVLADRDWDALGDRLVTLVAELEDQELVQLMLTLGTVRRTPVITQAQRWETCNLIAEVLARLARRWDRERRVLSSTLLDQWYTLRPWAARSVPAPALVHTWAELHPGSTVAPAAGPAQLEDLHEFLAIVRILDHHAPERLAELGGNRALVRVAQDAVEATTQPPAHDTDWFVPQDIETPPSRERAADPRPAFTRQDVARVLADL